MSYLIILANVYYYNALLFVNREQLIEPGVSCE